MGGCGRDGCLKEGRGGGQFARGGGGGLKGVTYKDRTPPSLMHPYVYGRLQPGVGMPLLTAGKAPYIVEVISAIRIGASVWINP